PRMRLGIKGMIIASDTNERVVTNPKVCEISQKTHHLSATSSCHVIFASSLHSPSSKLLLEGLSDRVLSILICLGFVTFSCDQLDEILSTRLEILLNQVPQRLLCLASACASPQVFFT